ncbi:glycoside hydrolase family 47 protein [Galbibacter sp. BG1]|uniref:glycoside hydrolase family 47 protein n=1 Tax=Galbibacter sp. BG1 TaxID=1170699 RepID=UPI0015BCF679|nr:glycoside hydrolase family 47 protein [Galbibacter sp. BG1]QLE01896.1 glycoside hydrolase family 47 protein [Galbibacter sp. BG1]
MNRLLLLFGLTLIFYGCSEENISDKVKDETLRTWEAYEKYAWPNDNLLPLSGSSGNWYENSIFMAPIDGYSTLKLMGFDAKAERIEKFVQDSLLFDKNIDVKVFEVNIRILGGLLCMYSYTGNPEILNKAEDFGNRLLKAFDSPTSLPYYYVNLKTGKTKGEVVNLAEAASYAFEFGILSYYSKNPIYYQTAKKAILKLNELKSNLGLFGRDINVNTGEWVQTQSMVGAYADSYFEYLYKSWLLFGDDELKAIWDKNISAINTYLPVQEGQKLWYAKADMKTGELNGYDITLWDAYFPALQVLSGDVEKAKLNFNAWKSLTDKYVFPMWGYNFKKDSITNGYYQLNPEIIESAFYLYSKTKDEKYYNYAAAFFNNLQKYCRTDIAYAHIKDVRTMEKDDQMETFFIAETMKYFYLIFNEDAPLNIDEYVFSTEAHPFRKSDFNKEKAQLYLGL